LSCSLLLGCATRPELDWNQEQGYRWAELEPGSWGDPGFEQLAPSSTGITFQNHITEAEIDSNQHYMNGSGVAAGDVDGDGWVDLYFARLNGPNRLYKNVGGFRFKDVTDSAGVAHERFYSLGSVLADVDGDGDLDLLVTALSKGIALYLNDGQGHFTWQSGLDLGVGKGNHTMALADIDGDSDLDLYVTNYKEKSVKDLFASEELEWKKTVKEEYTEGRENYTLLPPFDEHYTILQNEEGLPDRRETGEVDALYLNTGDGRFQKVENLKQRFLSSDGTPQGLSPDWGLAARFQDINQDGRPDLYVCNDFWTPDRIWINQGDGIFRALDTLAVRNFSFSSMTVDFSDVNRDGALDFFTTEMLSPKHQNRLRQANPVDPFPVDRINSRPKYNRNSLYRNRGDDTFAEISYFSGVEATGWSWASRFIDVDLDGYEDLLVTTGFSYDVQDIDSQIKMGRKIARASMARRFITEYPRLPLPNKAFHNDGNFTFSERSAEWGFTGKDISYGLATADFDHDGDLDLAINRLNEVAAIFENETTAPRIAVQLSGNPPNTQAIGAKVQLEGGKGEGAPQRKEITAGGDYLSGSAPFAMFAADPSNSNHVLTVTWPNGAKSTIDSVRANRIYDVQQPDIATKPSSSDTSKGKQETIFEDVSGKISHRHHEASYDDFRIQPLLPIKLSQQGPGISWIDYDTDGDDDLFIASGRGGTLGVFENDGEGNFTSRSLGAMTQTASADQTTILGWPTQEGTQFLVGNANYEAGDPKAPSAFHYSFQEGATTVRDSIPGVLSTTGPMAIADYDGDGDLDLFVGGRFMPAQYPRNATSRLFENDDGRFTLDRHNSSSLKKLGLVTGAVFTDYDGDGDTDLLISRAWDSLVLSENEGGTFQNVTEQVGLDQYTGWWNGVTTGDFNNDGRPDIVATNWGLNSPYQLDSERPLKMYYQDFNRDRRVEIVEAYYDPAFGAYIPRRQLNAFESSPVPFTTAASSHRQFANASLKEIFGFNPERRLSSKEVNTLSHTLFVNEGGHFSAHPLPEEAQFSAAFHAGVADFNNDGNEDLFLSQNFFEVRPQMPRLDAGRGLLLEGNGQGHFEAISGHVSGIKVYGSQRGAAFGDFNGDGKVDLAVSQNGAATKLYRNQIPKTGLIVHLDGPAANRAGLGSSLRLVYADGRKGPRRAVRVGAGYWSQGSATQIMGYSQRPEQIGVTWFDGRRETVDIVEGKRRYRVEYPAGGS